MPARQITMVDRLTKKQEVTMKTIKIVMFVALMAFVAMAYADVDPGSAKFSVKISLRLAKQDRGLVQAIYQQVDPRALLQNDQILYTVKVKYHNVVYVIYGKYKEWVRFFWMDPKDGTKEKAPGNYTDQPLFKSEH